MIIKKH